MPKTLPAFVSPGEEDKAICFTHDFGAGWERTPCGSGGNA
jgi:hypothetical protein